MTQTEKALYFGELLYSKGFKTWFLYMFRAVEGFDFVQDDMHNYLFEVYQNIYDGKSKRQIINICPRSAKTTLCIYLIAYAFAKNPKCNFIYTSYSADLLSEVSRRLASILSSKIYASMYNFNTFNTEYEVNEFDEFWKGIYKEDNEDMKDNKYSAKKITTSKGGVIVFSSMGGSLTGFGCGSVNDDGGFNGMLIIDDPDKTQNIRSEVFRERTHTYYSRVLLSRLNNKKTTPILNIQQRLNIEDFSGFLLKTYESTENRYNLLKIPLVKDGACLLSSQYGKPELEEIMIDNYTFTTQYQQEPILEQGNIIKRDWLKFYFTSDLEREKIKTCFITADLAFKKGTENDYSVMCVWYCTHDERLLLVDMFRKKVDSPELLKASIDLYNKWKDKNGINNRPLTTMYIEDKASGIGLIQQLNKTSIPVKAVGVDKDKQHRLYDVLTYIEQGKVFLPENRRDITEPFINECISFSRDNTHKHDDIVDCLTMALSQGYTKSPFFFNPEAVKMFSNPYYT